MIAFVAVTVSPSSSYILQHVLIIFCKVYAALIEWKTGHHVPMEFSRDNFNHTYRQYLKRFDDLRERFGPEVYDQYLMEYYETVA